MTGGYYEIFNVMEETFRRAASRDPQRQCWQKWCILPFGWRRRQAFAKLMQHKPMCP
jgi:hypothetical protein